MIVPLEEPSPVVSLTQYPRETMTSTCFLKPDLRHVTKNPMSRSSSYFCSSLWRSHPLNLFLKKSR